MINCNGKIEYTYNVYGLRITSEVSLSELEVADQFESVRTDVIISYGVVPKQIKDSISVENYIKISKNEFYLYIEGTAHYYVANGNKIIVEPEAGSDMEEVKVFILGTCFGILLNQRNTIAIHGGSVIVNGEGIILTGQTGAGKSTLTSAFRKKGYCFLADDVSVLSFNEKDGISVQHTYPQQKLCRDTAQRMGYDIDKLSLVDPYRDKYSIPLMDGFFRGAVPLAAIYEITVEENGNVDIVELLGGEKLKILLKSIYRSEVSCLLPYDPRYFKLCLQLVQRIPIYRIKRPKNSFTVSEQMEAIKQTLRNRIIQKEDLLEV